MSGETVIARYLRRILAPLPVRAVLESPEIPSGFEYFLPQMLSRHYDYWKCESFDGFFAAQGQKTGPNSAEFIGVCILISDQTVTPIHIRLSIAPDEDVITWMECKVGTRGDGKGGMKRTPFSAWKGNPLIALPSSPDSIEWVYRVSLGRETHSAT